MTLFASSRTIWRVRILNSSHKRMIERQNLRMIFAEPRLRNKLELKLVKRKKVKRRILEKNKL